MRAGCCKALAKLLRKRRHQEFAACARSHPNEPIARGHRPLSRPAPVADVRSVESRDAIAIAWASRRGREVPIGIRGSRTAASKAMIATAHTISSSVKPSCEETPSRPPACNVGRRAGPAFLSVGAERQDVICAVLTRRSIYIRSPPWIQGHNSTFEIRAVPDCDAGDGLHEGTQSFRARGTTAGVERKAIERACEALAVNIDGIDRRIVD